jgi:hypothetical protein
MKVVFKLADGAAPRSGRGGVSRIIRDEKIIKRLPVVIARAYLKISQHLKEHK